jgi:hypothetical protein
MISTRLLCAIGLGCIAVPAHAEEIVDAMLLYKDICIASNGDLLKGKQLAIANGFSIDASGTGYAGRIYTRRGPGLTLPYVSFKPAGSEANRSPIDVCQVSGSSDRMAEFEAYAQSQGLREISKEKISSEISDQIYMRVFVSGECTGPMTGTKCSFLEALGDPPVNGKFNGVFRFGIISPPHPMLEEE